MVIRKGNRFMGTVSITSVSPWFHVLLFHKPFTLIIGMYDYVIYVLCNSNNCCVADANISAFFGKHRSDLKRIYVFLTLCGVVISVSTSLSLASSIDRLLILKGFAIVTLAKLHNQVLFQKQRLLESTNITEKNTTANIQNKRLIDWEQQEYPKTLSIMVEELYLWVGSSIEDYPTVIGPY